MENTITIDKQEYELLLDNQRLLLALQTLEVEKWDKYPLAVKVYQSKARLYATLTLHV